MENPHMIHTVTITHPVNYICFLVFATGDAGFAHLKYKLVSCARVYDATIRRAFLCAAQATGRWGSGNILAGGSMATGKNEAGSLNISACDPGNIVIFCYLWFLAWKDAKFV